MNSNGKRQKASSYQKFYSKCSFTGRTGKKDRYGSGRHEGFDLAGTGDERQVYKNDKLTFISDDMLILGCDIGSEMHYARAIDSRGRELSRGAFSFSNSEGGFPKRKGLGLRTGCRQ